MKAENAITPLSTFTVLERAVIYARVSKDDRMNDGRNLAGQLEMGRTYAQEKGYRVVEELSEDERGASGAEIDLPQIKRVREMAHTGEFEVLIVRELDRLSRNLAKQLILEEELRRAGVRIEYVLSDYDDTPEGRLQKHIRATVAEYEREKIKERMVRGRRNKVKSGNILTSGGRCPYGYKLAEIEGRSIMELDSKKANIVRLIFRWYVIGGLSMAEISKRLQAMGAPLPNGIKPNTKGWVASSVGKILKNEAYTGTWYYGKYNCRARKVNPREQWLAVNIPVVISDKAWQAAHDRLEQNKKESKRRRIQEYLLSHRVTCGDCGCKCSGKFNRRHKYYICNTQANKERRPRACRLPCIRADHLDTIVWDWVRSKILDPKELDQGLDDYQAKQEERKAPLREQLEVAENLITENQAQFDRLVDLYLSGEFPKDMLTERKARIQQTLSSLKQEKEKFVRQLQAGQLTAEEIQTTKHFAKIIREEVETIQEDDFNIKRRIIELLDVRVTVKIEDDQKVVYVQSNLGDPDKPMPIVNTTTSDGLRESYTSLMLTVY